MCIYIYINTGVCIYIYICNNYCITILYFRAQGQIEEMAKLIATDYQVGVADNCINNPYIYIYYYYYYHYYYYYYYFYYY